jgi:phosphoenolpyruvate synthase/pyruvate phosphate dikinase
MIVEDGGNVREIGGKAFQLFKLAAAARVPRFFVVTADSSDIDAAHQALEHCIRRAICGPLAVRSSASCEDGHDASFAGMFDSILNVRLDQLADAVVRVRRSMDAQRVRDYVAARELDPDSVRMHVVVQEMVAARASGVCLTQTDSGAMLIEVCFGLGEALVSGRVAGDRYEVAREGHSLLAIKAQVQDLMLDGEGWKPVDLAMRRLRKLADDDVVEVATTAERLEHVLDLRPLDLEFAFSGRELYVLQARRYAAGVRA